MASNATSSKAIDSFLEYFKEAKPYHTQLLEVIEKYSFYEAMDINFIENLRKHIVIRNTPLCKQTGFGLDYDDNCGYDAIDCCDLFDCNGGYGVIFDNSDLVVSETMVAQNAGEGWFEVEGNQTDDNRFQILSIPSANDVEISGDASSILANHNIFIIVNMLPFEVVSNDANSLILSGNHETFVSGEDEFLITGTVSDYNGKYVVRSATYDVLTDETTVLFHSFRGVSPNDLQGLEIYFRNSEPNVGIYEIDNFVFDGTNTTITTRSGSEFKLQDGDLTQYKKGSVQFRTGFKYSREIDIDDSAGSEFHNILFSEYVPPGENDPNKTPNRTRIYVDGSFGDIVVDEFGEVIESLSTFAYVPGVDTLKMYGYFFNGGYDGNPECILPKETHIYAMFEESLVIRVDDSLLPTPIGWVDVTSIFNGSCYEYTSPFFGSSDAILYSPSGIGVSPLYGFRVELTLTGISETGDVTIDITTNAGSSSETVTISNGVPFLYELDQNSGVFDGVSGAEPASLTITPFGDVVIACKIEFLTDPE